MKTILMIVVLMSLTGCTRVDTKSTCMVKTYDDALKIVLSRPDIQERIKSYKQSKKDGYFLGFEDGGYTDEGSDVVTPDAWTVCMRNYSPERAPLCGVLYVSRKDGRVYRDAGLEPPVPLESLEEWRNREAQPTNPPYSSPAAGSKR